MDDNGDGGPDNGGGAENPTVTGNREFLTPMLRNGVDDVKEKHRPSLAHTKSLLSSHMHGAPKPKHDQDPVIYHYRDSIHDMTEVGMGSQNLKIPEHRNIKKKNQPKNQPSTLALAKHLLDLGMENILPIPEQNDSPQNYEDHFRARKMKRHYHM